MDMEKLEGLVVRLEAVATRMEAPVSVILSTDVPAYDRAELGPAEVVLDGKTINADGSVWSRITDSRTGKVGAPLRETLGYISPTKFPAIFSAARSIWGDDRLVDIWKANPYGLYKIDPRGMIFSGTADALNLGYALQAYATHQQ